MFCTAARPSTTVRFTLSVMGNCSLIVRGGRSRFAYTTRKSWVCCIGAASVIRGPTGSKYSLAGSGSSFVGACLPNRFNNLTSDRVRQFRRDLLRQERSSECILKNVPTLEILAG